MFIHDTSRAVFNNIIISLCCAIVCIRHIIKRKSLNCETGLNIHVAALPTFIDKLHKFLWLACVIYAIYINRAGKMEEETGANDSEMSFFLLREFTQYLVHFKVKSSDVLDLFTVKELFCFLCLCSVCYGAV